MIRRETITVSGSTGGAGVSTANATSINILNGLIRAIYLEHTGTPPSTTDVTIAGATKDPASAIMTITDTPVDGWLYPMGAAVNNVEAAITNQGAPIPVDDYVKVTIAQANDADGVIVTILYEV